MSDFHRVLLFYFVKYLIMIRGTGNGIFNLFQSLAFSKNNFQTEGGMFMKVPTFFPGV